MAKVSQIGSANGDGPTHNSRLMTLGGGLLDPPHGVPRHERKSCASPGYVLCLAMVAADPMVEEGCCCGGKGPEDAEMYRRICAWLGWVVQTDGRKAAAGRA